MTKRWDIEVLFLNGPMADYRPRLYKGPTVEIGSSPDVGGIHLKGISIAPVHARFDCTEGHRVLLHPIEHYEIRVAGHKNEDWSRIDPLYKAVPIQDGNVLYVGPLGHGIIIQFLRARSFELRQDQLHSVVDQQDRIDISIGNHTQATVIHTNRYPKWFLPSLAGMVSVTLILLFIKVLNLWEPSLPLVGPRWEGYREEISIDIDEEVAQSLLVGFLAPFEDFVMKHNQSQSALPNLASNPEKWDSKFYEMTIKSVQRRSYWKGFWKLVEAGKSDYALVVDSLRDAGLPEVLAGIPFQETRYIQTEISQVCAAGIWQFMPETGKRMGLDVRDCRLDVTGKLWSPIALSPPYRVSRDADYVSNRNGEPRCRIGNSKKGTSCAIDERVDIKKSTRAAIKLLAETYADVELAESGSLVQATILGHNAGYDDEPYLGKIKGSNVLPAYRRYRNRKSKIDNGTQFYGDNICPKDKAVAKSQKCKSLLPREAQHYGYHVVAFHILSVCYLVKNYPGDPIFSTWEDYLNGYCKEVHAPDKADL